MEIIIGGVEIFDIGTGNVVMEHAEIEPGGSAARRIWSAVVEWPLVCEEAIPLHVIIVRGCECGMGGNRRQEWSEYACEKKARD